MDDFTLGNLSAFVPILLFLLVNSVAFYWLWIKPAVGRKILSQTAPWLNDSFEGCVYRIVALLFFLFAVGLTIVQLVTYLTG
jgi:hypothetical protein